MSPPDRTPTHPAHATVWLRMPQWTLGAQRTLISAAIVTGGLVFLAGASGAGHRAGAAPNEAANTSISSSSPSWTTAPWSTSPVPVGPGVPTSGLPSVAPFLPPRAGVIPPTSGAPLPSGPAVDSLAADGIPTVALDAYRRAAAESATRYPGCGLPWPLLAAIGRVESDHGRFASSQLYADGTSAPRIVGIPLNGVGTALIRDTDHGRLDGDTVYDRAVGPMQFIPSTWANWGVDGNGDHVVDPSNIYDAATAAANYLCAAGGNLQTAAGQIRAVLTYNDSAAYLSTVLALEKVYATGVRGVTVPVTGPHPTPAPGVTPTLPPVDPGPPLAVSHATASPGSLHARPSAGNPTTPPAPPSSTSPGPGTTPPTTPTTPTPTTPTSPPTSPTCTTPAPTDTSTPTGSPSGLTAANAAPTDSTIPSTPASSAASSLASSAASPAAASAAAAAVATDTTTPTTTPITTPPPPCPTA